MRNIQFATGELYHIYNRAVEGREIFHRKSYTTYFLESLLVGNTTLTMDQHWRRDRRNRKEVTASPLVEMIAMVLMPNHFHVFVRQLVDDGIPKLLQRVCNSFAKYLNKAEERKGGLFMGPYQAVHVSSDAQAQHLITYIHANPLDLGFSRWREGKISDWKKAEQRLTRYESSSLPLYLNSGTVHPLIRDLISVEFASTYHKEPGDHLKAIREWSERDLAHIEHALIEPYSTPGVE